MKTKLGSRMILLAILLATLFLAGCSDKEREHPLQSREVDMASLEKEIEAQLRIYENHLRNGDSIALGNMYMEEAQIMPSTVGRDNIINVFGSMIRDSITESGFKTTALWGNNELLVEEGTGSWSHQNGEVVGRGRYLLVWQKDDGEWKILRDSWFPDKDE